MLCYFQHWCVSSSWYITMPCHFSSHGVCHPVCLFRARYFDSTCRSRESLFVALTEQGYGVTLQLGIIQNMRCRTPASHFAPRISWGVQSLRQWTEQKYNSCCKIRYCIVFPAHVLCGCPSLYPDWCFCLPATVRFQVDVALGPCSVAGPYLGDFACAEFPGSVLQHRRVCFRASKSPAQGHFACEFHLPSLKALTTLGFQNILVKENLGISGGQHSSLHFSTPGLIMRLFIKGLRKQHKVREHEIVDSNPCHSGA